ncbi:MAG: type II secretion system protein [Patescibacteria group bacterium]
MMKGQSKFNIKVNHEAGYSLVELALAMALFSIFAAGIISMVLGSLSSNLRAEKLSQAKAYLEESNEALRAVSLEAFNYLSAGTYGLNYNEAETKWELSLTLDDPDGSGPFINRTIVIEDIARDATGDMGTETNDPYSRKATTTIVWEVEDGIETSISSEIYLTAWEGNDFEQTDWSGGSGQSEWSDETKYSSDDGNLNTSVSGQVSLPEIIVDNSYTWDFSTDTDYTLSDEDKIQVADGEAKLILTDTITENPNQDFRAGTGSEPDYWGNGNGYGTWNKISGGYDDNYYIDISFPNDNNTIITDYWEQEITISEDNPDSASLTFQWECSDYLVRDPDELILFVTLDSVSGTPLLAHAITSVDITGSDSWQTLTISDLTAELATAGNYYLKIALYIDYKNGKKQGPFTVDIDNVDLQWTESSYATDKPYVEVNDSGTWNPESLGMILDFTETATKPSGTAIYYQLSNDNGSTWFYYNTTSNTWVSTSDLNQANSATDVNTYIKYFPVDDDSQIKFRAFFESDGVGQPTLDNIEMNFNPDTITMEAGTATITQDWTDIDLENTYTSPVVAGTYWETVNTDSPGSVRIRNAGASGFQARIEFPTDSFTPTDYTVSASMDYIVVEEGSWILPDGTYIEAHRYDTSTLGRSGRWNYDTMGYDLRYTAPLVLSQVMTDNDTSWITTWLSRNGSTGYGPASSGFQMGLNASQVSTSYSHGAEIIGYIVFENVITGSLGSTTFRTRITPENIRGHDDGCYTAGNYTTFTAPVFVGMQQTMRGGDGGWLVRCNSVSLPKNISWHNEEDQYTDRERNHTTEVGAFVVFEDGFSVNGKAVSGNYETDGYLISSAFNATQNFNIINWEADDSCDSSTCSTTFKIRTATDFSGLASASWQDISEPSLLNIADNLNNTWAQYRVDLAGDGSSTPILYNVSLNYY